MFLVNPEPGRPARKNRRPMSSSHTALAEFSSVVVTGGSSGLGKSFIELAAKMRPELRVCNLSRRAPNINLPELNLRHFSCDLADRERIGPVISEVESWLRRDVPTGRILLINNSGFGTYGLFPEPNLQQSLEMLDVNIRALVEVTGRLLPLLRERGGAVMNIASTAAFQPTPYMAAYGASKAYVLHWTLALNEELRGTSVRAIAVCPGPTATEFFRRAGLQQGSVADHLSMTAEEVVSASFRALAAGRAQVVTGWKNKVGAFFSSKLPKPLIARMAAVVLARFRLNQVKR